jgi:CBS domain-containing protein
VTGETPQDPVTFVRATPPFDALPPSLFAQAAAALEVSFYPAGSRLVRKGGEPLRHLFVIRKGSVRLERDAQTIQVLEEGESFGYTSLLSGKATLDVVVEEDLLAYLVPGEVFHALLADPRFAGHFAAGMADRLRNTLEHAPVATFQADLALPVGELLRRPAVWLDGAATVADAARRMDAEGISSVLVRGEPPGIVTLRDFRSRILARDLGPGTRLDAIASRPLRTTPAETPVYDAWAMLLDYGLHHLAVTRGGEVAGVLTSTDLLRHTAQGPVAVLRGVERLAGRDRLPGYARTVAEMTASLVAGGLDVLVVAGLVGRLNDALVRRLLRWAEADLGPAPAPWAWLALGSEGRMEQTLPTDQDNALVYADEGAAHREWFAALAALVNEDLLTAGFPRCPGGYMASGWHGTLSEWERRFAGWSDAPMPQALVDAAIFFDFRRVAGTLDLAPLEARLLAAAKKPTFLRFLAKAALAFRPPSFVIRLRDSTPVDLKRQAIAPVVLLSRCYGLEAGSPARGTCDRLEAAARAGLLEEGAAATVAEAYRFVVGLRLRAQLEAVAAGGSASDEIPLESLAAVQRSRLKDSLRAIRSWQDRAASHFHVDF